MSDRINCRNCIHFNDLEHRCCLNDGSATQKECYFTLSTRKPQGKDVVIEHLKTKIADLEHQLANCIKHKFDFGKDVWVIFNDQVKKTQINSFRVYPDYDIEYYIKFIDGSREYLDLWEDEIFATKEEAEKRLEELKK